MNLNIGDLYVTRFGGATIFDSEGKSILRDQIVIILGKSTHVHRGDWAHVLCNGVIGNIHPGWLELL